MKDLIKLYYVSSPSGKEKKMRKYIKDWCKQNVPSARVFADQSGIYITKGVAKSYPCIVAHIDEVHRERNNDYRVVVYGDYIFGYNTSSKEQQGIGADDKNGIWIGMQALLHYDCVKVALFVGEEIGCVGSGMADMRFFDDVRFVIQCDRRGKGDFITSAGGWKLCDEKFTSLVSMAYYGYKETSGLMTDVMELKSKGLKVAACNLSCGYYNPHTADETTVWSELCNCRDFVFHIIDTVQDVVPHEPVRSYTYYGGYGRGWYGSDYEDWYDDGYMDTYRRSSQADDSDVVSTSNGEVYTEEDFANQFSDMQDMMWQEWCEAPNEFDVVAFYDDWKYSYPALDLEDFEDALTELLYYYEKELAED